MQLASTTVVCASVAMVRHQWYRALKQHTFHVCTSPVGDLQGGRQELERLVGMAVDAGARVGALNGLAHFK